VSVLFHKKHYFVQSGREKSIKIIILDVESLGKTQGFSSLGFFQFDVSQAILDEETVKAVCSGRRGRVHAVVCESHLLRRFAITLQAGGHLSEDFFKDCTQRSIGIEKLKWSCVRRLASEKPAGLWR